MSRALRQLSHRDPIKEAAIATLRQVVDKLVTILFDNGITVQEFNQLIRDRAVRTATARVVKECGRKSKSRVAIMTGLPRSEVRKILAHIEEDIKVQYGQNPARRVLTAWYDNPRFLMDSGEPAVLPIFGQRRSFEKLVSIYGGGIPVRAMLDELTQMNAVECLVGNKVRAKSRVPIFSGVTPNAITAIGERCGDLLRTLIDNLRTSNPPLFEATALTCHADGDMVPLARRELATQGVNFISGANAFLKRSHNKPGEPCAGRAPKYRLGISVYYFEEEVDANEASTEGVKIPRKNLRRRRSISNRANR